MAASAPGTRRPPRRPLWRRYAHVAAGLLTVVVLLGILLGVLAWQVGWITGPGAEPLLTPLEPTATLAPTAVRPVAAEPHQSPRAPDVVIAADRPVPPAVVPPAAPPAPATPPAAAVARPPVHAPADFPARYAVEFGPFTAPGEAEDVEARLNEAGYQTVRFRQRTGAGLFAVVIEAVTTAGEAQALVATLREDGLAAVPLGLAEPIRVQVGDPLPLRGAVRLAQRLRISRHPVRIESRPGQAVTFVIRHGNFVSPGEADAAAEQLAVVGFASRVVRAR